MKIPLSNPYLSSLEKQLVLQVLNSSQLSQGPQLDRFENKMAQYIGSRHAVAVNSGTSALHLCIKSLGIGENDQVITTPFSFIASANCMLYERAKPVFVDINPNTYNIDADHISEKITARTKAILPVHVFGLPCDMVKIRAIAQKHHLYIIEDACEAIGADCLVDAVPQGQAIKLSSQKVGSIGDCGVFGFYPNKQITTGEGGMIVTNEEKIAMNCRSLRNQGRSENSMWLEHEQLGYNYRLSEVNCALGIAQLTKIHLLLAARARVARWYSERLSNVADIILPPHAVNCRRSWFVYVIRLRDHYGRKDRNKIMNSLKSYGIDCRDYFPPIHLQPFYAEMFSYRRGDFPNTEKVADRTIALPFFATMTEAQVHHVCKILYRIMRNYKYMRHDFMAVNNQIIAN
ncbi:DegT/DnrJ/EryC1/StrS family aminotransferase [candidate division KSB1 bacterium]|nr:DegT/DnrJ/EryC1/StrS family aminotransferase [candidate division KSB1 bacterium]RQW10711.1 MAG: DegT/DnrJ/EryC1/StrS family aminotransferase [candidate division KSB1 bacterium]